MRQGAVVVVCAVVLLAALGCQRVQPNRGPEALFTFSPASPVAEQPVTFDASASFDPDGDPLIYRWEFGDGASGEGRVVTHVYWEGGTFTVRLTVEDSRGASAQRTQDIVVASPPTPLPPVAAFSLTPEEGIAPLRVRVDASASRGSIVDYRWDFGDGTTASGRQAEHEYRNPGRYRIKLTVRDSQGRLASAEREVWVRSPEEPAPPPAPVAAFTLTPSEGVAPLQVTVDASPSRGEIVEYLWTFGDGATGTGRVVTRTYSQPGTYTIRLTVRDRLGRTSSAERQLVVRAPEPPQPLEARFTASPKEGQVPLTVSFDASGSIGRIVEYRWAFGDGATGTGVRITHEYRQPGIYRVRLTVRDDRGNEAWAEDTVIAAPVPPPPPG